MRDLREPRYPPADPEFSMALITRTANHDTPPPPSLPPPDEGIDWIRLISALKSRKFFVLLVTMVGTALGVAGARFIRPSYVVEARLWIEVSLRGNTAVGPIQSSQLFDTNAWEELLRSYRVLDDVVTELRLYLTAGSATDTAVLSGFDITPDVISDEYVLRTDATGSRFVLTSRKGARVDEGVVGDSVGAAVGLRWAPRKEFLGGDQSVEFRVRTVRDAARNLAAVLQSQMDSKGNFLRVTLVGSDPAWTTAILNAVIARFVEVAGELKRATLSERTLILAEQLDSARQRLTVAERALEVFRVRTITLPGSGGGAALLATMGSAGPILNNYFTLRAERDALSRGRAALQQALAVSDTGSFPVETLEGIPVIQGSAELSILLQELANKRAELRELRYRFTDESTSVQQVLQEIARLEKDALPARAQRLEEELGRREGDLDRTIAEQGRSLKGIPPRVLQEAQLSRDMMLAQELYGALQNRYEEARLAEVSSIPDVRILDTAAVPQEPESHQATRLMVMAFMASLGVGMMGAVLRDRMDPKLRYPVQVTRGLGLNILGGIPRMKRGKGRAAKENQAQLLEAFRSLRLSLAHSYGAAGPMVFTVSSPEQGDGKSLITSRLAEVFARQGQRTVIVDGDLKRGKQHDLMGRHRTPGLSDYLEGRIPADRIVQHVPRFCLDFIPAGTPNQRSGELLTSRRLTQLFSFLKGRYDVIIVDTPPLRAGVDALALSALTGNLLFVLRPGATDRTVAESKLELLDQLPVRVLGAVLNDIRHQEGVYRHYAYDSYYRMTEIKAVQSGDTPLGLTAVSGTGGET